MYPSLMQKVFDLLSWKKTTTDTTIPALQNTDASLQKAIDALSSSLLDKIYPVGTIYMSMNNVSPATFLGGTWEKLEDGRVLLAANSTYVVDSTGGEAEVTLTEAQLPVHTHENTLAESGGHSHTRGSTEVTGWFYARGMEYNVSGSSGAFSRTAQTDAYSGGHDSGYDTVKVTLTASNGWSGSSSTVANHNHTITNASTGSGLSHSNMQPYRAVYMWKRTA